MPPEAAARPRALPLDSALEAAVRVTVPDRCARRRFRPLRATPL